LEQKLERDGGSRIWRDTKKNFRWRNAPVLMSGLQALYLLEQQKQNFSRGVVAHIF
jgi:hypothetical protein